METKLSDESCESVAQKVDYALMAELMQSKGAADIRSIMGYAAESSITRKLLEEKAFILQPMIAASPIHTLHQETTLVSHKLALPFAGPGWRACCGQFSGCMARVMETLLWNLFRGT